MIAILLFFLFLISLCKQTHPYYLGNQSFPRWSRNRMFSISTQGPMASYFEQKDNLKDKELLLTLTDHFRKRALDMRNLHKHDNRGYHGAYKLCNVYQKEGIISVAVKVATLHLGVFTSNCITELNSPNLNSKHVQENMALFKIMYRFGTAVQKAGLVANRTTSANFRRVYSHSHFTYNDSVHHCEVEHVVGFRVKGTWAVLSSVTEFAINLNKDETGRRYLVEFLTVGNELRIPVSNLLVTLPKWKGTRENSANASLVPRTTTNIEVWRGRPASSIFRQVMPLDENRAVHVALQRGRQWSEQAVDSTTKSNIAIMVLSAMLTLVPVALVADVSLATTFGYALLTDVVSCMPLFIKGVELIVLSKKKHLATVSWVYGMESDTDIAIVETWCARCNAHNSLLVKGAVFICLSIAAIIMGLLLEIYTRIWLKHQKKLCERSKGQGRNAPSEQMWMKCCDCERDKVGWVVEGSRRWYYMKSPDD